MIINTQNGTWGDDGPEKFAVSWTVQWKEDWKTKTFKTFREACAFQRRQQSLGLNVRLMGVS